MTTKNASALHPAPGRRCSAPSSSSPGPGSGCASRWSSRTSSASGASAWSTVRWPRDSVLVDDRAALLQVAHEVAHVLVGRADFQLHDRLQAARCRRRAAPCRTRGSAAVRKAISDALGFVHFAAEDAWPSRASAGSRARRRPALRFPVLRARRSACRSAGPWSSAFVTVTAPAAFVKRLDVEAALSPRGARR